MSAPKKCGCCDGKGFIREGYDGFLFSNSRPIKCPICDGTGYLPGAVCVHCGKNPFQADGASDARKSV